MKKLVIAYCAGALIGLPVFASDLETEETSPVTGSFEALSLEEQEKQNNEVKALLSKTRQARERAAQESLERSLINSEPPSEDCKDTFNTLNTLYNTVVARSSDSEDFRLSTDRVRRGLVVIAAALRSRKNPFAPPTGTTENEWPQVEQAIWKTMKELLEKHQGDYGGQKQPLQSREKTLILQQQERRETSSSTYVSFVFNSEENASDKSLNPALLNLRQEIQSIEGVIHQLKQVEALKKISIAYGSVLFWLQARHAFTQGLHLAQQKGWDNWSRTCIIGAFLDAKASFDRAEQEVLQLQNDMLGQNS